MKKEPREDDAELWSWWQTLRLRMEVRKRMNPITPDRANKRKLIVSGLYFVFAAVAFHMLAFNAGVTKHNPDEQMVALERMNKGKLISIDNFKIKKITDFRSEDFDSQIKKTNKPSTIME